MVQHVFQRGFDGDAVLSLDLGLNAGSQDAHFHGAARNGLLGAPWIQFC
jgi:hypothetical protein